MCCFQIRFGVWSVSHEIESGVEWRGVSPKRLFFYLNHLTKLSTTNLTTTSDLQISVGILYLSQQKNIERWEAKKRVKNTSYLSFPSLTRAHKHGWWQKPTRLFLTLSQTQTAHLYNLTNAPVRLYERVRAGFADASSYFFNFQVFMFLLLLSSSLLIISLAFLSLSFLFGWECSGRLLWADNRH